MRRGAHRAAASLWASRVISSAGGGAVAADEGRSFGSHSHQSDMDLAMFVSDFLENGGNGGAESRGSSDSESGLFDLAHLADKISVHIYNQGGDEKENELLSMVHSLLFSIHESELLAFKRGQCSSSCIRHLLVKLLRYSGYDAAVCVSKWQGFDKIPGGDHEYIDVMMNSGTEGRLIIDINFRSHFEIARAVDSYGSLLNSLKGWCVGVSYKHSSRKYEYSCLRKEDVGRSSGVQQHICDEEEEDETDRRKESGVIQAVVYQFSYQFVMSSSVHDVVLYYDMQLSSDGLGSCKTGLTSV